MAKSRNSIQIKLTFSFGILVLVMSCLSFFYTYNETKKTIKDLTMDELKTIASVAAASIDGDVFAGIKPGQENSAAFKKMRDLLQQMERSNPAVKYIYTYAKNDDKSVKFVIDADYGIKPPAETADIGEIYKDITAPMMEGFEKPAVENEFSSDKWGIFLSGYAPIRDSKGKSVGAVGVDIMKTTVLARQNFIGDTIYVIFAIAVVLTAILITFFSITLVRDIKEVNAAVREMVKGNTDYRVRVNRGDEIGDLAESLKLLAKKIEGKIPVKKG